MEEDHARYRTVPEAEIRVSVLRCSGKVPLVTTPAAECVFCRIASGAAPADVKGRGIGSVMFVPQHPVTPGHLLVIPNRHVKDAYEDPARTATTMYDAAQWAHVMSWSDDRYKNVNLITSIGPAATQSVFHLHVHIVPRTEGDGLHLPWTGQNTEPREGL